MKRGSEFSAYMTTEVQIARDKAVISPLYRASAEEQRLKLAADLEAFAQRGGEIQCVPSGVSGQVDQPHRQRHSGGRTGRPKRVVG